MSEDKNANLHLPDTNEQDLNTYNEFKIFSKTFSENFPAKTIQQLQAGESDTFNIEQIIRNTIKERNNYIQFLSYIGDKSSEKVLEIQNTIIDLNGKLEKLGKLPDEVDQLPACQQTAKALLLAFVNQE